MNGFRNFCLYSLARASIFMLERCVEECDKNGNKRMEFVVGGGRKLVESLLQSEERRLITHGSRISSPFLVRRNIYNVLVRMKLQVRPLAPLAWS